MNHTVLDDEKMGIIILVLKGKINLPKVCPKEDIRQMERTLSANYPVLRQIKGVLLKQHCTLMRKARRDR